MIALLGRQKFQGHFGAEQGTAQVHQDQHAVRAINRFNGSLDLRGVGPYRIGRIISPASYRQRYQSFYHLRSQVAYAFGELGTVRNDNNADHGPKVIQSPSSVSNRLLRIR